MLTIFLTDKEHSPLFVSNKKTANPSSPLPLPFLSPSSPLPLPLPLLSSFTTFNAVLSRQFRLFFDPFIALPSPTGPSRRAGGGGGSSVSGLQTVALLLRRRLSLPP